MNREPKDPRYATSLLKALDVMEALGDEAEVPLREVSRRCGFDKATVHRILTTLLARGYVERVGDGGSYRLGIAAYELGVKAVRGRDVRAAAREAMRSLLERTGEMAHLCVPAADGVVVVDQVPGSRAIQMRSRVGERLPLEASASGLAYLSALDPAETDAAYPQLAESLRVARARGYAADDCMNLPDLRGASAPIFGPGGLPIGIIGVSAPAYRLSMEQIEAEVGPAVAAAGRDVSARLGGTVANAARGPQSLQAEAGPPRMAPA